jgi:hypothetical protein
VYLDRDTLVCYAEECPSGHCDDCWPRSCTCG